MVKVSAVVRPANGDKNWEAAPVKAVLRFEFDEPFTDRFIDALMSSISATSPSADVAVDRGLTALTVTVSASTPRYGPVVRFFRKADKGFPPLL